MPHSCPELYPYLSQGIVGSGHIKAVQFYVEMHAGSAVTTVTVLDSLLTGSLNKIAPPAAITDSTHQPLTLYFDNNSMEDLWIAMTWRE
jgi:hypothetical protein